RANGGIKKSELSMLPNFIALMPCLRRTEIRVNTTPSNRTIVSAPRYFGIKILQVCALLSGYLALAQTRRLCGGRWNRKSPSGLVMFRLRGKPARTAGAVRALAVGAS